MPAGIYPRTLGHGVAISRALRGKKRPQMSGANNPAKRLDVRKKIGDTQRGVLRPNFRRENYPRWSGRDPAEIKLCGCGCGTSIFHWQRGGKKNKYGINIENRYAIGHHNRGRKRPDLVAINAEKLANGTHVFCHPKRGPVHPQWKDGKAAERQAGRQSPEYAAWRDAVYKRDHFTCQIPTCGKKPNNIVAHHYLEWVRYPEYRYKTWNGITLCHQCHKHWFHEDIGKDTRFVPQGQSIIPGSGVGEYYGSRY